MISKFVREGNAKANMDGMLIVVGNSVLDLLRHVPRTPYRRQTHLELLPILFTNQQ